MPRAPGKGLAELERCNNPPWDPCAHSVSDDDRYNLWVERLLTAVRGTGRFEIHILQREERFARLMLRDGAISMKVDLVNDVPTHIGIPTRHPVLGMLDTAENVLANKFSALAGRNEPKDLADVWVFCVLINLSALEAIQNLAGKAAGLFPPEIARIMARGAAEKPDSR